jgi:nucleotide-binding universal stress UspA family protein
MNTILIATDFSEASENAMLYGANLAHQLNIPIVLTNIFQTAITMNDMPIMAYSVEELKNSADAGLERCSKELQGKYPALSITTESRLGFIQAELNNIAEEINPFAIVMGSHNVKGLERIVFGSTTVSVVRHSHYPVFAIPADFKKFSMNNVVLAADLEDIPDRLSSKITEVIQKLGANLHIVHVKNKEETKRPDALLEKLNVLSPSYETIEHKKVHGGLRNYVQDIKADLLILLPHEHNLIDRLFFKVHTEDIITSMSIPVLAIKC